MPAWNPASAVFTSAGGRNRETISTAIGRSRNRSLKVAVCCWASTVVGTSTSTWRPPVTAFSAARTATSVLPKPTSPHTSRSIGRSLSMSSVTASITRSWSFVSS